MANHDSRKRAAGRKPVGKRALSLLMALVMSLSLVQITAFAAETGSKDQIMPGYYEVDANGNIRKDATGSDVTTTNPSRTEGGYTLSKTIEATSVENQFNITLQVVTQQTVKTNDAAVQLVIDTSGSMKYCAVCGVDMEEYYHERDCTNKKDKKTRLEATQEAIAGKGGFLDSLVAGNANGGKLFVSVAQFSYGAERVCDWVDITAAGGLQQVKDAVNGLEADGGTNLEAAMMLARNRLQMDAVASAASKYTVLLTDGEPTYRCTTESVSVKKIDQGLTDDGSGSRCSEKERNEAKDMATQVKELSKLYTICYGVSGDVLYGADKCVHCGKTQKEHKETWYPFYGSVYYCRDNSGNTYKSTAVTIGDYLRDEIATPTDTSVTPNIQYAFNASDTAAVNAAFANIASSTTEGINASGTTVTDPMGEFIVLGTLPEGATASDGTLTWSLGQPSEIRETTGQNGEKVYTYIYTYTYPITLDTSAKGFEEGKYYPTNGPTYLSVPGSDAKYYFNIPGVKGTVPTVPYTVEYYYQDRTTGQYGEAAETVSGTAKLWSSVTVTEKGRTNYTLNTASSATIGENQLTESGQVFRVYYDLTPVTVVVEHYLSTVTKTDDGEVTSAPELKSTDTYPSNGEGQYYMGDSFSNTKYLTYTKVNSLTAADGATYTSDNDQNVPLSSDVTTIKLYYTTDGEDQRTPWNITVDYYYRSNEWELNSDGKYELVKGSYGLDESKRETHNGHMDQPSYTAPAKGDGYTLDKITLNGADNNKSYAAAVNAGANTMQVYYEKDQAEPEQTTLTIIHKFYNKTINGNELAETVYEYTDKTVHVGETWTASDKSGNGYAKTTAAPAMSKEMAEGHNEIVVEYVKDVRTRAEIEVNHTYYTYKQVINQTTGEAEWRLVKTDADLGNVPEGTYYVGQNFTATPVPNGFQLIEERSDTDERTLTDGKNVFNFYYETYIDELENADVTVIHHYETYRNYVNDQGQVIYGELVNTDKEQDATVTGKAGEFFEAELKEKDGFQAYKADTLDLRVTLRGEKGEYHIYYKKTLNELGELTPVMVQPIYKTYETVIDPATGEEKTVLIHTETADAVKLGDFYPKQIATAIPGTYAKDGFTFVSGESTANASITVSENGDNVITLVYAKTIDSRTPAEVILRDHYRTIVKEIVNGKYTETVTEDSLPVNEHKDTGTYYLNSIYATAGKGTQVSGYELDGSKTQPAETIQLKEAKTYVDFYWLQVVDKTKTTKVEVVHHYTIHDENPDVADVSWIEGEQLDLLGNTFYVGQKFVAAPNFQNGIFEAKHITEVTPAGAIDPEKGIILAEEENVIHIYYVKEIDTRPAAQYTVIHEYYTNGSKDGASDPIVVSAKVGDVVKAEEITKVMTYGDNTYTYTSADPETLTVAAEGSVITLRYDRTYNPPVGPSYTYYTVTVNYYDKDSGEVIHTAYTTTQREYTAYDVTAQDKIAITGYTYVETTGDALTGTLNGNKVINVYYTKDSSIDDGNTPTDPGTDIGDDDVPVTPAKPPKTGDSMGLWIAAAMVSGMGLIWLSLSGKKRKEEI